MTLTFPAGLVVHAALADRSDCLAVEAWALEEGLELARAADLAMALEGAVESARPALIVTDATERSGDLVDARTLVSIAEQPIGVLLVSDASDWLNSIVPGEAGLEPIGRPLERHELTWRALAAFRGGAHGQAARDAANGALEWAACLAMPSVDPAVAACRLLVERFPGVGFSIARWRGDSGDLFDVSELARSGSGRPDWARLQEALRAGQASPAVSGGGFRDFGHLMMESGLDVIAAAPITEDNGLAQGAVVAWSATDFQPTAGLDPAVRMVGIRLTAEFRFSRLREHSRRLVERDALTRLANRAQFNERLGEVVRVAQSSAERLAVLLVNLDRFKSVNEAFGHALADRVLVESARRVRQAVRGTDLVARYAGDEFAVCLRELRGPADAEMVASKLRAALSESIQLDDGLEARLTASIGVCHFPDDADEAEDLVRQADIALRAGKGLGTDQTHVFVADLRESRRERATLESRLRAAEGRGELRLFFQPQVSARDEDIVGVEALIRWEQPDVGMVSPGFFIPLAEETGLIVPIGRWVLFEACRQARAWQIRFGLPLRVAVNLSAVQLGRRELVADVTAALAETGLPAETLELEVTESVSVKRIPHLLASLEALRSLGCQIAIDDFGTGQASLDYIRRFPADRIKIDQVFVRNIGVDPDDEAIVRATIGMAHSLGRHVVAEGVEYEQHAAFLREQGCDELQGFLFCRPLPVSALEELLAERERLLLERR
jgi:diguanylate cyclase (GGDEF)-like protein